MKQIEIPQCEIIGFKTSISDSMNKELIGRSGKIIFETKNMIVIETTNGRKQIPKNICKFLFESTKEKIVIDGEKLVKKPYERLKKYHD